MKEKLPQNFKFLLWSYDFSRIDLQDDAERIIINAVNYGDWVHWQWITNYYGRDRLKRIIENIPASEFRKRALKLISLILKIKRIKYVSQGIKIRAEGNIF